MYQRVLVLSPSGRGFLDVTSDVADVVRASGVRVGLVHLFLQHTSASLLIQENASPDVQRDLEDWFARAVPDGDPRYRHDEEGPDDMSAHIRTALTSVSLTIPVTDGRLALGTWQAIYLYEHRYRPSQRKIVVTVQG